MCFCLFLIICIFFLGFSFILISVGFCDVCEIGIGDGVLDNVRGVEEFSFLKLFELYDMMIWWILFFFGLLLVLIFDDVICICW